MRWTAALCAVVALGCGTREKAAPPLDATPSQPAPPAPLLDAAAPPSPYLEPIVELALGENFACALVAGGDVACWGAIVDELRTRARFVAGLHDAVQITAGSRFACARRRTGTVSCWGDGEPVEVRGLAGVVHLDAGKERVCAAITEGAVYCWTAGKKAARVSGIDDAVEVAVSSGVACARTRSATVRCWGKGGYTGDGSGKSRKRPVQVVGLDDVAQLAALEGTMCARRNHGDVVCWGGASGLGDGTPPLEGRDRPGPVLAHLDEPLTGATELWAETPHACVRKDDRVWCWGGFEQQTKLPELLADPCPDEGWMNLCMFAGAVPVTDDPNVQRFQRNSQLSCVLLAGGRAHCAIGTFAGAATGSDDDGLVLAPPAP